MRTIGLVLFLISLTSCNTVDPPADKTVLTLTLEDVSCTEAWITLTTNNLQLPATINLLKNNTTTKTINLQTADTLLYIDSLLPNQTYNFQAILPAEGRHSSNEITVTTLDTTSHNFTWQSWTFGEHSSSTLYDVAIVNENCIYAVGEIYMYDSLGRADPNAYNAVHWDGTKWELKKIGGQGGWTCHTVYAFSANDIWFEGNIHWNGSIYTVHMNGWPLMPNGDGWQVNKMWGSSSNDLYVVGNEGNIAHWNGSKWTKIESGTTLPIQAIWGSTNDNGEEEIICVASDRVLNNGNEILQIVNNSVKELNNQNLPWSLSSIWFKSDRKYYIVGDGIYTNWSTISDWKNEDIPPLLYKHIIYGSSLNDIIIAGAYGLVLHYNGYRWSHLMGDLSNYSNHLSAELENGTMVVVGMQVGISGYQAKIIMGKR